MDFHVFEFCLGALVGAAIFDQLWRRVSRMADDIIERQRVMIAELSDAP